MKRRDFEKHLRAHGCEVVREGAGHTIFENATNGRRASVPRHNEIKTPTMRQICVQLEIPHPEQR